MHFKVTARTILQLGAELISSDAIAFYELIKNAFDAGSKNVTVRVVVRISQAILDDYFSQAAEKDGDDEQFDEDEFIEDKKFLTGKIDFEAPFADGLEQQLLAAKTPNKLKDILKGANYITIEDKGDGMSMSDLEDVYLTIGTRYRRKQREENSVGTRPILGEKGLGRLSVMRLGDRLRVETTKEGEKQYHVLEIDWTEFSHDSDSLLETISITPKQGKVKPDAKIKGTVILISDLKSSWTQAKLEEINKSQLSRFIDPFAKKNREFIQLWFNNEPIVSEGLDKKLFQYAHAVASAKLEFEKGTPVFHGELDYRSYNRKTTFSLSGTHLASVLGTASYKELLQSLGPFSVQLYWFNRQLLRESEGVLDAPYIKHLVDTWGGGLMVYRDGFRVNPYGGPGDDWLSLDPMALASGGYKLNRKQIVGKVDISSEANPLLLDQTNREGLRSNPQKDALVTLLRYLFKDELRDFLDEVKKIEEQNIAALSLNEIEKRIETGQKQVKAAVEDLKRKYPQIKAEKETLSTIEEVLEESALLFARAKASADVLNSRLKTTIELAGLGLMVDVIGHELNRSTKHALDTINTLSGRDLPAGLKEHMDTLRLQLKTLQTRLKVIDPLGPSGRQQKVLTDLRELVNDVIRSHQGQFKRHKTKVEIIDRHPNQEWKIRIVPGMVVQILENLIANSIYWIKQEQNVHRLAAGNITIVLNRKEETITFSDNGPGIPREKKENVFRPFYSTKPPGDGKGLGLYISREMARYHNASLTLLDTGNTDNLNTFILNLKAN